jgi:carboxyl-terminal processing protease
VLNRLCAELKESHLAALTPRRAHEYSTEHRAGVGFRWQPLDGQRVVTDIVPGSPAAAAGVQPGWLVVSRNGQPLPEKDAYVSKLGLTITYGFLDGQNQPRSVALEPQLLNFERLEVRELPGGRCYLRFDEFSHTSLHWLSRQLKAHGAAPAVVIDLRYNHGGNLLALDVALAEFFPGRVTAGRLIRRSGHERENESFAWLSAHYAGRVAILTDHFTASAAEIFSHVLQHHHRAVIIGRPTAGAVIVARDYALPGGGRLQVPVTDYIGLDGQRLEGRGVAPDVVRPEFTLADLRAHADPDLAAAMKGLQQSDRSVPGY